MLQIGGLNGPPIRYWGIPDAEGRCLCSGPDALAVSGPRRKVAELADPMAAHDGHGSIRASPPRPSFRRRRGRVAYCAGVTSR